MAPSQMGIVSTGPVFTLAGVQVNRRGETLFSSPETLDAPDSNKRLSLYHGVIVA